MASEPKIFAPFSATTGVIRQNTPIGESFKISSMIIMLTSPRLTITFAKGSPFSPERIIPNPKNKAMTITCSITASESG